MEIYLPRGGEWIDYWNHQVYRGGRIIDYDTSDAEKLPLFVRAGSIIPMRAEANWIEPGLPDNPIFLDVYPSNVKASFTLYEDDGLSYSYEKGESASIPIQWNEASQTLAIGKREGSFRGMLKERTFNVILVSKDKPVGFSFTPQPDGTVHYDGRAVEWRCR